MLSILLAYGLFGLLTAAIALRDRRDSLGVTATVGTLFAIGWPLAWAIVIYNQRRRVS